MSLHGQCEKPIPLGVGWIAQIKYNIKNVYKNIDKWIILIILYTYMIIIRLMEKTLGIVISQLEYNHKKKSI